MPFILIFLNNDNIKFTQISLFFLKEKVDENNYVVIKYYILLTVQAFGDILLNSEVYAKMPKTLADIKKSLECHLGKRLQLRANGGRKKTVECAGVLSETYRAVFVVELDQEDNACKRVSYSYTDILTEAVEITFLDDTIAVAK